MSPGSYVYNPHYTWKDYIEMAGGYESYADTKDVYVYRANGSWLRYIKDITQILMNIAVTAGVAIHLY